MLKNHEFYFYYFEFLSRNSFLKIIYSYPKILMTLLISISMNLAKILLILMNSNK